MRAADVFDYVAKLPASSLAAHGVSDPLPQQVRVEFDRYFCKAGQFPRPEELSRYDGFYITGSLAGVYDDEPWIKQLDSWTANAIRSGHKVRTAPAAQLLLKGCSIPCCSQVVGISFGHQMVVQALGGKVESAPNNLPAAPLFSVGNENGASAGRKPVRLLCQQNGNEADPGGPAVLRDQPERLRLALSPQRRGHAHAWARGGAHRDGRQQDHAQQRRVRHARDCPHLLRTPRACFSLPPSLSLPLSLPLSLSATSPTSVSDLVRDNHRRITRTVPPSCTSCSRSIAT